MRSPCGCWVPGSGKSDTSYGATDEFGRKSVQNVSTIHDFWATALHLMGLDHERLTWYHNGWEGGLTDVHGHVIQEVLS